jgi:hypothetical protein
MTDKKPMPAAHLDYWARKLHDGDHPLIEEVRRMRAREQQLVELCCRAREAINGDAWTVLDEDLRAAIDGEETTDDEG